MATRFYLPSSGAADISPAFDAAWDVTTNADRLAAVTTRISSAMTNKAGVGDASVAEQLLRQYISAPLEAQTISGTVKGVMRMASNVVNIGMGALAVRIAKCAGDGSGVTQILAMTYSSESGSAAPPGTEGTTLENRRIETGANGFTPSLTSTAVDAGDRLIIELGYKDNTTNTGRHCIISFGDDSATDLPEDETTTTADNPWVEFSMDIAFLAASNNFGWLLGLLGILRKRLTVFRPRI